MATTDRIAPASSLMLTPAISDVYSDEHGRVSISNLLTCGHR